VTSRHHWPPADRRPKFAPHDKRASVVGESGETPRATISPNTMTFAAISAGVTTIRGVSVTSRARNSASSAARRRAAGSGATGAGNSASSASSRASRPRAVAGSEAWPVAGSEAWPVAGSEGWSFVVGSSSFPSTDGR